MRKSSSECSSSSSVPGQVFVGLCENLWTLFAISVMGPGQVGSVWPLSHRSSPSPDVPLGILHLRMSHPWCVSGPPGWKHLSVHARDSQNEPFVQFWKTILAPLISRPMAGPPAACLALWVSATPSLGSAACFPGLWMLAPLKDTSGNLLRLALYPDRPQLDGEIGCDQHWCCWMSWLLELSSCRISSLVCFSSSFQESILASYLQNVPLS